VFFLKASEQTQSEFCVITNTLHINGKICLQKFKNRLRLLGLALKSNDGNCVIRIFAILKMNG